MDAYARYSVKSAHFKVKIRDGLPFLPHDGNQSFLTHEKNVQ